MKTDPLTTEIRRAMGELAEATPDAPAFSSLRQRACRPPSRRPVAIAAAGLALAGAVGIAAVSVVRDPAKTSPAAPTVVDSTVSVEPNVVVGPVVPEPLSTAAPVETSTFAIAEPPVPSVEQVLAEAVAPALPPGFVLVHVGAAPLSHPSTSFVALDDIGRRIDIQLTPGFAEEFIRQAAGSAALPEGSAPVPEQDRALANLDGDLLVVNCRVADTRCGIVDISPPVDAGAVRDRLVSILTPELRIEATELVPVSYPPEVLVAVQRRMTSFGFELAGVSHNDFGAWTLNFRASEFLGLNGSIYANAPRLPDISTPPGSEVAAARIRRSEFIVLVSAVGDLAEIPGGEISELAGQVWLAFSEALYGTPAGDCGELYTIQPGDYPALLSKKLGFTWAEIATFNALPLDGDSFPYPDVVIKRPCGATAADAPRDGDPAVSHALATLTGELLPPGFAIVNTTTTDVIPGVMVTAFDDAGRTIIVKLFTNIDGAGENRRLPVESVAPGSVGRDFEGDRVLVFCQFGVTPCNGSASGPEYRVDLDRVLNGVITGLQDDATQRAARLSPPTIDYPDEAGPAIAGSITRDGWVSGFAGGPGLWGVTFGSPERDEGISVWIVAEAPDLPDISQPDIVRFRRDGFLVSVVRTGTVDPTSASLQALADKIWEAFSLALTTSSG